mmetsp:Transcript_19810/g.46248  ORF Transcript_19810/g.46248 Transcript_19810/m.46248 type:complete len:394 (-) Transcript_19810:610-1791(-)
MQLSRELPNGENDLVLSCVSPEPAQQPLGIIHQQIGLREIGAQKSKSKPLGPVNGSASIHIGTLCSCREFFLCNLQAGYPQLSQTEGQLANAELPIVVLIESEEQQPPGRGLWKICLRGAKRTSHERIPLWLLELLHLAQEAHSGDSQDLWLFFTGRERHPPGCHLPLMPQCLTTREAVLLRKNQELLHQVLSRLGDLLPPRALGRKRSSLDLLDSLLLGRLLASPKRIRACQHDVQDHAQGPSVSGKIGALSHVHLRRSVGEGSNVDQRPRLLICQQHGRPEVAEFQDLRVGLAILAINQEILWLYVSVHNPPPVKVRHSPQHLPEVDAHIFLVQAVAALLLDPSDQQGVEFATPAHLKHQVQVGARLEALMHPDDLRMIQASEHGVLTTKT